MTLSQQSPRPLLIVAADTSAEVLAHLKEAGWAVLPTNQPESVRVVESRFLPGPPADAMGRAAMQVIREAKTASGETYRANFASILLSQEAQP